MLKGLLGSVVLTDNKALELLDAFAISDLLTHGQTKSDKHDNDDDNNGN